MMSRILIVSAFFLIGLILGCVLSALLAQRASYYWAAEQMGRIASDFEQEARQLAMAGHKESAREDLSATIRLRRKISEIDQSKLSWPLDWPSTMFPEYVLSPSRPSINVGSAFSDRALTFIFECALVELSFPDDPKDTKEKEREKIVARYPNSNAANCAALGAGFWSKYK